MPGKRVIAVIKQLLAEWASPREPDYLRAAGLEISMPERCTAEECTARPTLDDALPNGLKEFWRAYVCAALFEDIAYGQWGLRLLDFESSNRCTRELEQNRPQDSAHGDRVIGEFIGDFDRLIIRCDPGESDFGRVLVAIPDGPRSEWYRVADSLAAFLEEYRSYDGQKYWEPQLEN